LVSEFDIKSAPGPGFKKAAILKYSERMQDGFHAQPVIFAERSNGWETISGTEDVGLNLDLQGIG
jgi:hypothetical protein